jgi:hypothetical protein
VIKLRRGATVPKAPQMVKVLNEHVLIRRGVPSGEGGADASTQTESGEVSPRQAHAAPAAAPQSFFPAPTSFEAVADSDMVGPPAARVGQRTQLAGTTPSEQPALSTASECGCAVRGAGMRCKADAIAELPALQSGGLLVPGVSPGLGPSPFRSVGRFSLS